MNPSRSKPAHEIRFGTLKAAIWRNETENGHRFNTTFTRSYKDGEQWHNTDSFGRDDLLIVAKLADQAHSWIHAQGRESMSEASAHAASPEPSNPVATASAPARSGFSRNRG